MTLNFVFNSSDHLRYENGIHISGPHGGAPRAVKVEPNITGGVGYTVTMFNTDGQYVVQMAPKQMKIIQQTKDEVVLRGYGYDRMGSSFADYGLSIYYENDNVEKCILHMHDRNIDIEYLKSDNQTFQKETSQDNEFEEIRNFLQKFMGQPMDFKIDLAGKTDNLNNIGVDYYESGDIDNAILYYNKALDIYPINDDALKNLIVCYRQIGNFIKINEAQKKLDYLRELGL